MNLLNQFTTALRQHRQASRPASASPCIVRRPHTNKTGVPGVHPVASKYNPYRAYFWNGVTEVYVGMFPTIEQASAARASAMAGIAVTTGTTAARVAYQRKTLGA